MLVKIAMVGEGEKWHIIHSPDFTYCGARPDWTLSGETEMAKIEGLCANCKREFLKKGVK